MGLSPIKLSLLAGWMIGAGWSDQAAHQQADRIELNPPSTAIDASYVAVAKRLLGNGLADPAGGKFCKESSSSQPGFGGDRTTFGWVLPGDKRIVLVDGSEVNIDGSVTPVVLKEILPDLERSAQYGLPPFYWPGISMATPALLLRVNEPKLAEQAYKWLQRGSHFTSPEEDLVSEQIQCLEALAYKEFALSDDVSARRDFDRLIAAWQIRDEVPNRKWSSRPQELERIQLTRTDIQRRIDHPERSLELQKLPALAQADRIRILLGALDTVGGEEPSKWGFPIGNHPIVKALISEGKAAVPALIDAMETDKRLCRAVIKGDLGLEGERAYSDKEVAWYAIKEIWPSAKTLEGFDPATNSRYSPPSTSVIRAKWAAVSDLSDGLRWLLILRNDAASKDAWSTAASGLVSYRKANSVVPAGSVSISQAGQSYVRAASSHAKMAGVDLSPPQRSEASRLMARRAAQIIDAGKPGEPTPCPGEAFRICEALYAWDPKGCIPTLREVCDRILLSGFHIKSGYMSNEADEVVNLISDRSKLGDPTAATDYARLFKILDRQHSYGSIALLKPIWSSPLDAAMQRVSAGRISKLYKDLSGNDLERAKKAADDIGMGFARNSLITDSNFRRALVVGLRNHMVVGSFHITNQGGQLMCMFTHVAGGTDGTGFDTKKFPEWKPGMTRNVELCDDLAHVIVNDHAAGEPEYDLMWSDKRRGAARVALIAWLSNDKLDWKKIQRSSIWTPVSDGQ